MADVKKPQKIAALRVSSRPETFRRGGQVFSRSPQDIPLSTLSKEQIAAIKGEPLLAVLEVEIDTQPSGEGE